MPSIFLNSHIKQLRFCWKQVRRILQSNPSHSVLLIEAASFVFALSLILPLIMIGVGMCLSYRFVVGMTIDCIRNLKLRRVSIRSKYSGICTRRRSYSFIETTPSSLETIQPSSGTGRRRGN